MDLLIGDPRGVIHPVEVMGKIITFLRSSLENHAQKSRTLLNLLGLTITLSLTSLSLISGWLIEQLLFSHSIFLKLLGLVFGLIAITSILAAGSLRNSVKDILKYFSPDVQVACLSKAKSKLGEIVGRDVNNLSEPEILRALAETASENSVDGIFAPMFWMFAGLILCTLSQNLPGPIALGWLFKASSTIDSMLGYKEGNLKWIGATGARLDDILTWVPCRLVLLTLPLISKPFLEAPSLIKRAWIDGKMDSSPNSGLSEAIFAYCANIRMGGPNYYRKTLVNKAIIGTEQPPANYVSINKLLNLSLRLEIVWLICMVAIYYLIIFLT